MAKQPTKGEMLFQVSQTLVRTIGTRMLRQLFDRTVGPDIAGYLEKYGHYKKLKELERHKRLTQEQVMSLPPNKMDASSSEFDMTLLFHLLQHVCGLSPPTDRVWRTSIATDLSIEADLNRLRICRNQLAHNDDLCITDTNMTYTWNEMCQILLRLNKVINDRNLEADIFALDSRLHGGTFDNFEYHDTEVQFGSLYEELNLSENIDQPDYRPLTRYKYMTIDIGTALLRKLLMEKVNFDFGLFLSVYHSARTKIDSLIGNRVISEAQERLLPPLENHPDPCKFDVPLLVCLLTHVCTGPETEYIMQLEECRLQIEEERIARTEQELRHVLYTISDSVKDSSFHELIDDARKLDTNEQPVGKINIEGKCCITEPPLLLAISPKGLLHLTSLSLGNVKMKHIYSFKLVQYINKHVLLQRIELRHVTCHEHRSKCSPLILDLQNHTKLTALCLYGVNIICNNVNCFKLMSLMLNAQSQAVAYEKIFYCIAKSQSPLREFSYFGYAAKLAQFSLVRLALALQSLEHINIILLSGISIPANSPFLLHSNVCKARIVFEYVRFSQVYVASFIAQCIVRNCEVDVEFNYCIFPPPAGSPSRSYKDAYQYTIDCLSIIAHEKGIEVKHIDNCSLHMSLLKSDPN